MAQPHTKHADAVDQAVAEALAFIEKQVAPESGLNELQMIQFYVRLSESIKASLGAIESLMESD